MAAVRAVVLLLLVPLAAPHPMTTSVPAATTPALQQVSCDAEAHSCWSQGLLPLGDGAWRCAEPLSQGPCRAGEWFTLDLTQAHAQPRPPLRGRCAPRPCPDAQLPWDGRCLGQDDARVPLCGGRSVHLDPAGNPRCGGFPGRTSALAALALCVETQPSTTALAVGGVHCAQEDHGDCAKEVVVSTSRVVIEPED